MIRPTFPIPAAVCSALSALLLAGCEKPEMRVYTVAKDSPAPAPAATPPPSHTAPERTERPRPQISYKLPAGWQETGSNSLSLVNFRIKAEGGEATVNITPLAGMKGREAAIVNMWRAQVGQPVLNDQDAAAGFTPVEIAGGAGQLFEVTGTNGGQSLRIVTAFAHRGDESWFYKLQGPETIVAAQRPAFIEFLKTVKVEEGSTPATASTKAGQPAAEPEAAPAMVAPEGWQTLPPGQMQVAKFAVATPDGAKAEVSVSVFPSDTGGTLANVNRWRRQLGMTDVDEAGLQEIISPLGEPTIEGAPGAVLAELSHENRRLLGAIVPREGKWWFYKMTGDAAAVNAERENFVHFAKSQP